MSQAKFKTILNSSEAAEVFKSCNITPTPDCHVKYDVDSFGIHILIDTPQQEILIDDNQTNDTSRITCNDKLLDLVHENFVNACGDVTIRMRFTKNQGGWRTSRLHDEAGIRRNILRIVEDCVNHITKLPYYQP